MTDTPARRRNIAAIGGGVFAALAPVAIVSALVSGFGGTEGAHGDAYSNAVIVVIAGVAVLCAIALTLGVIGIRRSPRLGSRGLAVATVVVSAIILLPTALLVLANLVLAGIGFFTS